MRFPWSKKRDAGRVGGDIFHPVRSGGPSGLWEPVRDVVAGDTSLPGQMGEAYRVTFASRYFPGSTITVWAYAVKKPGTPRGRIYGTRILVEWAAGGQRRFGVAGDPKAEWTDIPGADRWSRGQAEALFHTPAQIPLPSLLSGDHALAWDGQVED